jgi:hypothetical protein
VCCESILIVAGACLVVIDVRRARITTLQTRTSIVDVVQSCSSSYVNDPSEPCEQSSCYARTIAIIALSLNIGRTCVGREDTSLIGFDLFSSPHNFHHFFVDSFTSTSHKSLLVHDVSFGCWKVAYSWCVTILHLSLTLTQLSQSPPSPRRRRTTRSLQLNRS